MYLDTFPFIGLFSYLVGSFPLTHLLSGLEERRRGVFLILLGILQGGVVLLFTRLLIGTGVAAALGGIFLFLGQRWSIWRGFLAEDRILYKGLGFWLLLSPQPLFYSLLFFLLSYLLFLLVSRKPLVLSLLFTSLLFPFICWYFTRYDLYLILATCSSFFLIYELVPYLFGPTIYRYLFFYRPPVEEKKGGAVRRARFFLLSGVLLFSLIFLLNRHIYRGFGLQVDLFSQGNPQLPYIALTFDDGPDPSYTPAILDILAQHEVKATFFLVGDHVRLYPEIAQRIVEEGHEIGNHTQHHRNLYRLAPHLIAQEIEEAQEIIYSVTGEWVHLFRPPRGLYDENVMEIVKEQGYTLVLWSLSSRDWAEISARSIQDRILRNIQGGDVLLFHDSGSIISRRGGNRYNTIKALPGIITGLQELGYRFLTITELIIIDELSRERGERDDPEGYPPGY